MFPKDKSSDDNLPFAVGSVVTLNVSIIASPTFTTPSSTTVLTFTLAVTDSLNLAEPTPDTVLLYGVVVWQVRRSDR